jgi:hypothetical protein
MPSRSGVTSATSARRYNAARSAKSSARNWYTIGTHATDPNRPLTRPTASSTSRRIRRYESTRSRDGTATTTMVTRPCQAGERSSTRSNASSRCRIPFV